MGTIDNLLSGSRRLLSRYTQASSDDRESALMDRECVLIIGASRGLGLDLARTYAARGARLAVCARDEAEVLRAHAELTSHGATVLSAVCDATSQLEVETFVATVLAQYGRIDVLVTCATTIQVGPIELMTTADFEEAMEQIFWTTYYPTMAVVPDMRARGSGKIVHITSFGGKLAIPHLVPYCAAKFAAAGFSAGMRAELRKDGIFVTTVAPGLMRTGAHVNAPFKGQHDKEYLWFSAGSNLPLLSMPSWRAAQRIVRAADRGVAECTLSMGVRLAIIASAFAPGLVSAALALENRLLPSADGGSPEPARGMEVAARSTSRWVRVLDAYGRNNAEQHHAYPGPVQTFQTQSEILF